jgi:hypothetical protein
MAASKDSLHGSKNVKKPPQADKKVKQKRNYD